MKRRRQGRSQRGVTLLELMIVVVIVGILAAIAYPSYIDHVRKSRRADAQSALLQLAQFMERYYTEHNCYLNPGADGDCQNGDAAPVLPFTEAPIDGGNKYYDLALNQVTVDAYTVRATPKGVQAGDGYLELTDTGRRRWDEDGNGAIGANEDDWEVH